MNQNFRCVGQPTVDDRMWFKIVPSRPMSGWMGDPFFCTNLSSCKQRSEMVIDTLYYVFLFFETEWLLFELKFTDFDEYTLNFWVNIYQIPWIIDPNLAISLRKLWAIFEWEHSLTNLTKSIALKALGDYSPSKIWRKKIQCKMFASSKKRTREKWQKTNLRARMTPYFRQVLFSSTQTKKCWTFLKKNLLCNFGPTRC